MEANKARGAGITTRQMESAPRNAVYVWLSAYSHYPRNLARKLGREDLKIIAPERLFETLIGQKFPVVIDHATLLNGEQADFMRCYKERFGAEDQK